MWRLSAIHPRIRPQPIQPSVHSRSIHHLLVHHGRHRLQSQSYNPRMIQSNLSIGCQLFARSHRPLLSSWSTHPSSAYHRSSRSSALPNPTATRPPFPPTPTIPGPIGTAFIPPEQAPPLTLPPDPVIARRRRWRLIRRCLLLTSVGLLIWTAEDILRISLDTIDEIHAAELEAFLIQHYAQAGIGDRYTYVGLEEHPSNRTGVSRPPTVPLAPDTPMDPMVVETLAQVHHRLTILGWIPANILTSIARFLLLDSSRKKLSHEFVFDEMGLVLATSPLAAWIARLRGCLAEYLTKQSMKEARLIGELEYQQPNRMGLKALRQSRLERSEYWLSKAALFNMEGLAPIDIQHQLLQQWMELTMACENWAMTKKLILRGLKELKHYESLLNPPAVTASSSTLDQLTSLFGSHSQLPPVDKEWIHRQQFIYSCLQAELSQRQHKYDDAIEHWLDCLGFAHVFRQDVIDKYGEVVPVTELKEVEEDPMNAYLPIFTQLSHCAQMSAIRIGRSLPRAEENRIKIPKVLTALASQGITGAMAAAEVMTELGFYLPRASMEGVEVEGKEATAADANEDNEVTQMETKQMDSSPTSLTSSTPSTPSTPSTASPSSSPSPSASTSAQTTDTPSPAPSNPLPPASSPIPTPRPPLSVVGFEKSHRTNFHDILQEFDHDIHMRLSQSIFVDSPFEAFLKGEPHPNELMDYVPASRGYNPFQLPTMELLQFQVEVARSYQQLGRFLRLRGKDAEANRAFELAEQGTKTAWVEPYARQEEEADDE